MQHALCAGLLISIACGIVGTLVVVNRMSFIAGGVAHAAYGGLGIAVFFGLPPAAGILPFSIASAMALNFASNRKRERSDALIGVLWAAGMATGIILIDLTPGYRADLMSYLFGSIATVSKGDLFLMMLLDTVIVASVIFFYKELLAVSYDEEFAAISGVAVTAVRCLMLCFIASTVVMLIQAVGLILVIALFTVPASIAEMFSKDLRTMMVIAVIFSAVITISGLFISYYLNLNSGATIVLAACLIFGISFIIKKIYPGKV